MKISLRLKGEGYNPKFFLHFVGRQFYSTRLKFIKEAQEYGVTRRVSLQDLKKMNYGDIVLLAMQEGTQKILFGFFVIEIICGLGRRTIERLINECEVYKINDGGREINRNCGMYTVGATYGIEASIPQIAEAIEKTKDENNVLMIGGSFEPFPNLINLKNIPHRMGFRLFDWEEFQKAELKYSKREKIPYVEGLFYVEKKAEREDRIGGYIQEILNYIKKKREKSSLVTL